MIGWAMVFACVALVAMLFDGTAARLVFLLSLLGFVGAMALHMKPVQTARADRYAEARP